MMRVSVTVLLAAVLQAAASSNALLPEFAGYQAVTDIEQHLRIDLDVINITAAVKIQDWEAARAVYEGGLFSAKGDNLRVLSTFSTALGGDGGKAAGQYKDANGVSVLQDFYLFSEYYGDEEYAHNFVIDALNNTGDAQGLGDAAREQFVKKGIQYQTVWMYVLYEMAAGITKCFAGTDGGVKNWDEAAAFYVGSSIDADKNGKGALLYTFADKRCKSFGTCDGGATGHALANAAALSAIQVGRDAVQAKDCAKASEQYLVVRKQMIIPLVQGVILYSFNSDAAVNTPGNTKAMAEAWAFARGIMPYLKQANEAEAAKIRANVELKSGVTQTIPDGWETVATSLYSTLAAMCISCEEIGANAFPDAPQCTTDTAAVQSGCVAALRPLAPADEGGDSGSIILIVVLSVVGALLLAGTFLLYKRAAASVPSSTAAISAKAGDGPDSA